MTSKTELKAIIAWTILGYICVLMIDEIGSVLESLVNVAANSLNVEPTLRYFFDLIPELLILIFWIFLIFKYFKRSDGNFILDKFPTKFAKSIAIITLILFVIGFVIKILEISLLYLKTISYPPPSERLMTVKMVIKDILFLAEIIVIIIGFLKIIKKNALPPINKASCGTTKEYPT
jgi:hypothetical protein